MKKFALLLAGIFGIVAVLVVAGLAFWRKEQPMPEVQSPLPLLSPPAVSQPAQTPPPQHISTTTQQSQPLIDEFPSQPSVIVTKPNGGEVLISGQPYTMEWQTSNLPDDTRGWLVTGIIYPRFRGDFGIFSHPLQEDKGTFSWSVVDLSPQPKGEEYWLEVCVHKPGDYTDPGIGKCDRSDASFNIVP